MFEWIFVILNSLKLAMLPIYQGEKFLYWFIEDRMNLLLMNAFVMNALPFFFLWLLLRSFFGTRLCLLVTTVLVDILCFTMIAKIRLLEQPVNFNDIFELGNALKVSSVVWNELPPKDYLVFLDIPILLVLWKKLTRKELIHKSLRNVFANDQKRRNLLKATIFPVLGFAFTLYFLSTFYAQAIGKLDSNQPEPLAPYWSDLFHYAAMGPLNYFATSGFQSFIDTWHRGTSVPAVEEVRHAVTSLRKNANPQHIEKAQTPPNVILILMESLGRKAIDSPALKAANVMATPFFNSLTKEIFLSKRIFAPVIGGATVESEFMILNSLLPLTNRGYMFSRYMNRSYRSLPWVLKRHGYFTAAFHGNVRDFWHRRKAYKKLDFDLFESMEDFMMTKRVGMGVGDDEFFQQVALKLRRLRRPFFAQIITLSAHRNYKIPHELIGNIVYKLYWLKNLTPNAMNYLCALNYSDRALKRFWDSITDLRKNSIVIIVGDHGPSFNEADNRGLGYTDKAEEKEHAFQVPLLISAPFLEDRFDKIRDVRGDLADIAPTILNMLGIKIPEHFIGDAFFSKDLTATMHIVGKTKRVYSGETFYNVANAECFEGKAPLHRQLCDGLKNVAESELVLSEDIVLGKRFSYSLK